MRAEYFNQPLTGLDLELYYCGYEDCIDNFYAGPFQKNEFLLHFVIKGNGFFKADDATYEVKENDYFIIFPNQIVRYWSEEKPAWSFCWIAVNGDKAADYLKDSGISRNTPVKPIAKRACHEIKKQVDQMLQLFSLKPHSYRTGLLANLYSIISIIEQEYKDSMIPSPKKAINDYVNKGLLFIEYNYNRGISVKEVAEYVNLDRSYFSKIFKRQTGISPQEYILNHRVTQAIQLLKTTSLSLEEISKCVGIDEEYYFWRVFKKSTGYSPSEYRKTILRD